MSTHTAYCAVPRHERPVKMRLLENCQRSEGASALVSGGAPAGAPPLTMAF